MADGPQFFFGCPFRAYPEMFYSGGMPQGFEPWLSDSTPAESNDRCSDSCATALTAEQTDAMYTSGLGLTNCTTGRFLGVGSPAGGGQRLFVHVPQGLPYGLLVHDFVDRFLLHFFTQSAHTHTRGTFSTPESTTLDRNGYDYAIASAGQGNVPLCLKWALAFEEPETRTLWLAKAIPRDWLVPGEAPLVASRLSTRYGRVSVALRVTSAPGASPYVVHANVTLPLSFAAGSDVTRAPTGGIRLRIRAPPEYAGRLSAVTLGSDAWKHFDAAEETVDIPAKTLCPALIKTGLPQIVATFSGAAVVPLRRAARVDPTPWVLDPKLVIAAADAPHPEAAAAAPLTGGAAPQCPGGSTRVDTFEINGTTWAACEDLQQPGGALVLVSGAGVTEWFSKGYSPFNSTDDSEYYLGLDKRAVAAASTDLLGAKLLEDEEGLSWAHVERAVPPIRAATAGGACRTNRAVRTFVGSRGASVDTTFDPFGGDSNWEGWPSKESFAINMHNKA
eukprot:6701240-Prymnesium_polylepis.1